jgi:predicted PurR-regulated permease PerM
VLLRGVTVAAVRATHAPEGIMLAAITVATAAAFLAFGYWLGPRFVSEFQDLASQLSGEIARLKGVSDQSPVARFIVGQFSGQQGMGGAIGAHLSSVASTAVGGVAMAVILIVTALYFAISPRLYLNGIVRVFPIGYRPRAHAVLREIGVTLQRWSLGQLIDMVSVGIITGVGMALLGLPMALALAVLAGLLTFIPYFGAVIAAIPAAMIGLTVSWHMALWVLVIFLVGHIVEGYVISPLVQRRTARLPPALTILSMTVTGTLFGTLGVILGTPIAAALLVIVREVYVADMLGDHEVAQPE